MSITETTSESGPPTVAANGSAPIEHHHRDGWYFSRLADGSVRLRRDPAANPTAGVAVEHIIAPNEWASIVAHVADGGSGLAFTTAQILHAAGTLPAREPVAPKRPHPHNRDFA